MHPAAISIRTYSTLNFQRVAALSPFLQRTTRINGCSRTAGIYARAQYPAFQPLRTMASANAGGKGGEWLVIMPDKPGVLNKRIEVRDTHLNNLGPILQSGFLKAGGAMFEHQPKEGETPPMKGSFLIVQAETVEAVREILEKDVYATSGVWDVDNMQVTPIKCAVRQPM